MSAPGRFQACDLRGDVGVGVLVARLRDDLRALAGDRSLEALRHVLAEVVVLEEDADLRPLARLGEIAPVDGALADVALEEAHRPRVARRLRRRLRTVADEELRHLALVQVRLDRLVVRGADGVEDREDLVLLDEPPRLLDGLHGVVGVVVEAVVDLPPVHAALRVHVGEVRLRARADRAERRGLARERNGAADHDLLRSDAGIGRRRGACGRREHEPEEERDALHPETRLTSVESWSLIGPIVAEPAPGKPQVGELARRRRGADRDAERASPSGRRRSSSPAGRR